MSRGINKVILVGNLGSDPETRYTAGGQAITSIRIATSESWKDKQTGEMQERTEWHRIKFFGRLAEILGTDRRRRDGAERPGVLSAMVVEAVNGAARNAEGLPRPDIDPCAVNRPRQHALEAVDRLFVVIVAVRGRRETLGGGDRQLEERDAAGGVRVRDQEAHAQRPEADRLVGRIDVQPRRVWCHGKPSNVNCVY